MEAMPGGWSFHSEVNVCCEKCGRPFLTEHHGIKLDGTMLHVGDKSVRLTLRERDFFALLFKHFGQVVHRERIRSSVWGENYDEKSVDVYALKLRRKLAPLGLTVKNTWGVGKALVRLADEPEVSGREAAPVSAAVAV